MGRKLKTVLQHAGIGAGVGWLLCSYMIRQDDTGDEMGLFHVPTKFDALLVCVCAFAWSIYAVVQLARNREP